MAHRDHPDIGGQLFGIAETGYVAYLDRNAIPVVCPNPGTLIINRSGSRNRSALAKARKARVISNF